MTAQHDTPEAKRHDIAQALECAEQDEMIRVCRGDPAVCTKYIPPGMACCAYIRKTRDLTVQQMLDRSKPN